MTYRRSTLSNAFATVLGCCVAAAALPARAHDPAEGINLLFAGVTQLIDGLGHHHHGHLA
jgi:hypothetical protein